MRARVSRVAVLAVVVALLLFALPLGVVTRIVLVDRARAELQATARATALAVGPASPTADRVELPPAEPFQTIGVYDASGHRRAGSGPAALAGAARTSLTGSSVETTAGGQLMVVLPVASGERVTAVVRVAEPDTEVWRQVILAWLVIAAVALAALLVAVGVARWQSGRLAGPLERLSDAARRAGEGDLSAHVAPTGVREMDQVARTHNAMLERITEMLRRERHISTDASHQLRTPLAGLQLELVAALEDRTRPLRPVVRDALAEVTRLQDTVEQVLEIARADPARGAALGRSATLSEVVSTAEERWHSTLALAGRRLEVAIEQEAGAVEVPSRVIDQVLDVLLDNACQHGTGEVRMTVRDTVGAAAVDVEDEGSVPESARDLFARGATGDTRHTGTGIGLALARTMAEAAGARVVLSAHAPTRFTLFLPVES